MMDLPPGTFDIEMEWGVAEYVVWAEDMANVMGAVWKAQCGHQPSSMYIQCVWRQLWGFA